MTTAVPVQRFYSLMNIDLMRLPVAQEPSLRRLRAMKLRTLAGERSTHPPGDADGRHERDRHVGLGSRARQVGKGDAGLGQGAGLAGLEAGKASQKVLGRHGE